MQNCFMGLLIDVKTDPTKIFKPSGPSLQKRIPGQGGPTLSALEIAPIAYLADQGLAIIAQELE